MSSNSDETTTEAPPSGDAGALLAAYICGAVGLIIILGVTFYIVRKVRLRKARKYIKQQSKRTIGMGPKLANQPPPPSMWKWKEVKASIKARRAGQPIPAISKNVANGEASNGTSRPASAASRPGTAASRPGTAASRPASATSLGQPRSKVCFLHLFEPVLRAVHISYMKGTFTMYRLMIVWICGWVVIIDNSRPILITP